MCVDALVYEGSSRFFARRGGIAKRGEGNPSITPTHHEKEVKPSYFQSEVSYKNNGGIDIEPCPPSPPLSPKTTVAWPIAQRRQRVERKRDHPYQQPSSNRRPSWRPNLKQEFLRRNSINSTIASFDEATWFESECGVPPTRKRSSAKTASARSESTRSEMNLPKPRQKSTLLHPSSPGIESATSDDPFLVAPNLRSTSDQDQSAGHAGLRFVMTQRKGSSLLHPSRPASDSLECLELRTVLSLPPKLLWSEDRIR